MCVGWVFFFLHRTTRNLFLTRQRHSAPASIPTGRRLGGKNQTHQTHRSSGAHGSVQNLTESRVRLHRWISRARAKQHIVGGCCTPLDKARVGTKFHGRFQVVLPNITKVLNGVDIGQCHEVVATIRPRLVLGDRSAFRVHALWKRIWGHTMPTKTRSDPTQTNSHAPHPVNSMLARARSGRQTGTCTVRIYPPF